PHRVGQILPHGVDPFADGTGKDQSVDSAGGVDDSHHDAVIEKTDAPIEALDRVAQRLIGRDSILTPPIAGQETTRRQHGGEHSHANTERRCVERFQTIYRADARYFIRSSVSSGRSWF